MCSQHTLIKNDLFTVAQIEKISTSKFIVVVLSNIQTEKRQYLKYNILDFFFRIIVLDKGCVMEYDTPNHLLKDPNSLFYELARNAGILK